MEEVAIKSFWKEVTLNRVGMTVVLPVKRGVRRAQTSS